MTKSNSHCCQMLLHKLTLLQFHLREQMQAGAQTRQTPPDPAVLQEPRATCGLLQSLMKLTEKSPGFQQALSKLCPYIVKRPRVFSSTQGFFNLPSNIQSTLTCMSCRYWLARWLVSLTLLSLHIVVLLTRENTTNKGELIRIPQHSKDIKA